MSTDLKTIKLEWDGMKGLDEMIKDVERKIISQDKIPKVVTISALPGDTLEECVEIVERLAELAAKHGFALMLSTQQRVTEQDLGHGKILKFDEEVVKALEQRDE